MSRLRRAFGVVSADVARDPNLGPTAKALYTVLCTYADEEGLCFPSNETLAQDLGRDVSTVKRAVTELVGAHVITRQDRYVANRQVNSVTRLTDAVTHRVLTGEPPGGGAGEPQNKTSSNKTKKNTNASGVRSTAALTGEWIDGHEQRPPEQSIKKFGTHAANLVKQLVLDNGTLGGVVDDDWQRALDTARHLGANGWYNLVAAFYGEDGNPPVLPTNGHYALYHDGTFATW